MRINVRRLAAGKTEWEKSLDFNYNLDLSEVERWGVRPFPAPVRLSGRLTSRAGILTLYYKVSFTREEPCARCLETVKREVEAEFTHTVVEAEPGNEAEAEADGLIPAYSGFLDMDELAVADILLSQEGMLLCDPGCKGLCPKCGANLNENPCSCTLNEPDPRFAKLAEFMNSEGSGG